MPDSVKDQELYIRSVSQSSQLFTLITVCSLIHWSAMWYIQKLQNESFNFKFKNTHNNKILHVDFMVIKCFQMQAKDELRRIAHQNRTHCYHCHHEHGNSKCKYFFLLQALLIKCGSF